MRATTLAALAARRPAVPAQEKPPMLESRLEVLTVATGEREVVHTARRTSRRPTGRATGASSSSTRAGGSTSCRSTTRKPGVLDTGFATRCNNDHGLSPDGKWLAISHSPETDSLIYVLPASGGTPHLVTPKGPSYWHGWSPDGKTLAYCAERGGEYDVYTIPVEGGEETRLTTAPGLDDGPDYAPDGRIWFNSVRTGVMKIWRMDPDGRNQVQMTATRSTPTGSPTPRRTASRSCSSPTTGRSRATRRTRTSCCA
jgi:TolB protein